MRVGSISCEEIEALHQRIVPQSEQIYRMTNSQRLAAVRMRLEQWLHEQSGAQDESSPKILGESILIRDGFYCGRQFDAGDYRAVWFMEEDELKIASSDGKWLCSLSGEALVPQLAQPQTDEPPAVISMSPAKPEPAADVSQTDRESGDQEIRRAA
tara:strand:- start:374141 stop:374608 length:468 start_codon:yes stop_codon:yes gene_type:complete